MTKQEHLQRYAVCDSKQEIARTCTCPSEDCLLRLHCCACLAWHRDNGTTPLPHCLRDLEGVSWTERE